MWAISKFVLSPLNPLSGPGCTDGWRDIVEQILSVLIVHAECQLLRSHLRSVISCVDFNHGLSPF